MDSGNQTPVDQVKDSNPTVVTNAATGEGASQLLKEGDLVAEKYKVIKLLGHGGMGSVYKVEQIFFRQFFALKTLTGHDFPDVVIRRFQKEAQAAMKLNHSNLVRAHDFGILNTQQPFYIMDLIEGENLSDYSKRIGTLSLEEILRIFIPICFALGYAHAEGIVHRDLKPGNIMLDKSGGANEPYVPKVVDFGIAKLTDNESGNSVNLTRTGEIFGTPLYMSPEQCLGVKIDHRTDIYSLGCVMYEVLTGAPPFHGDSALSLMMKHQSDKAPGLKEASLGREFPPALEAIVAKTLEKNPDDRYQSLIDLAEDLSMLQNAQDGSTQNITLSKTSPHFLRQSQASEKLVPKQIVLVAGMACLAVGFAFGVAVGFSQLKPKEVIVEKVVGGSLEDPVTRDDRNKIGKQLYGTTRKGPAGDVRVFHFPKNFSIGEIAYTKNGITVTEPAQGVREVPLPNLLYYHIKRADLDNYPLVLKGFGEYDVQHLHLQKNKQADWVTDNSDIVYDAALVYCSSWKALLHLNVYDTTVSDIGLRSVQHLPTILNVELDGTKCTAAGVKALKNYPNFYTVAIGGVENGKSLIPDLAKSKITVSLGADRLDLGDHEMKLISGLKQLVSLRVSENPKITDTSIEYLKGLRALQHLMLLGTAVSPKSLDSLASMKTLQQIGVNGDLWKIADLHKLQAALPKCKIDVDRYVPERKRRECFDWKQEQ